MQLYKIYSPLPLDDIYLLLSTEIGSERIGAIRLEYNWSADGVASSSNCAIVVADPEILKLDRLPGNIRIKEYVISPRLRPLHDQMAHIYIAYPPHLREQEDRFARFFTKTTALVNLGWVTTHQIRRLDVKHGAIILFHHTVDFHTRQLCYVLLDQLTWIVRTEKKDYVEISHAIWCPRDLISNN